MPARKILVVDDDDVLRDSLVEQLSLYEEFDIEQEGNAAKGIQTARAGRVDLVVMDVGLPDMDGREAVKLLRKGGFKAPVIMLTGQDSESDTILGLEAGANDYVTKPFRFAVLLARIRAQLRQHEQSEDAVFTDRPLHLPAERQGAGRRARPEDPPHREGDGDPQIPLPRRREGDQPRRPPPRGVGLQFRRHHAHARNPHLPPPPEDREGPVQGGAPGHRRRRLQAGA